MLNRPSLFAVPLALALPIAGWGQESATQAAQAAAGSWLALTDAGQYGSSWDEAAGLFKTSVTKEAWSGAMKAVRLPLGALTRRQLKSATPARSLPGAPDGEYVVIQYDTQFQNKLSAVETVTPMREKDGSWRVTGYFIR